LQLIPLGGNQILVVVVSQTGLIRHRVVSLPRPISSDRLAVISNMLNERLVGLPLSEVRTEILHHIDAVQQEQADALDIARELARDAFDLDDASGEVYVEGRENLFSIPEDNDFGQLSGLMKIVEQKSLLANVLERAMKQEGLSVKIGSENSQQELRGVSLVSSTYKMGDNTVGVLGIMGPRRMEYGRMMALVESVAKIVNQMLARMAQNE
ncbi:MAG TPA: HrcA family transcriptional regulator, partial [Elusimicrobiota bacterium]|nr:HrcA family transcriptional regulator [Elusimicrobiota bacterium]